MVISNTPKKKENPSTERMFDRMDPRSWKEAFSIAIGQQGGCHTEVCTIRGSSLMRAAKPTMISTAFEKVALRRLEGVCPTSNESCSVAIPRSYANSKRAFQPKYQAHVYLATYSG